MCCVSSQDYAALSEVGERVIASVEDGPDVEICFAEFQETYHVVAVAFEVFESIFSLRGSSELVVIRPVILGRVKGYDVQGLAVVDRKGEHVSARTHLRVESATW